jgi:SAM-dependent methyltransferase
MENDFWALGPNVTGYPGGYPNGFLERCRAERIWGARRLHVCSGSVEDGVTVDLSPSPKGKANARPTIVAEATRLPFKDAAFDVVLADPPYSDDMASGLYGVALVSAPKLLAECARVVRPGGLVGILDWRVWPPPTSLKWKALIAIAMANLGPKPLRAFSVYRRGERALETFGLAEAACS